MPDKMNIVWTIVIWLAVGSIPASFATHWVLENLFEPIDTLQNGLNHGS